MGIAENIKLKRLRLGLSQQELADRMGYKSRSTITRIEAGDNKVSEVKMSKFARVLDTTVEFLNTGQEIEQTEIRRERKADGKRNIAIILAGGKSTRNLQNVPNQFINVIGKPVIIYSLEAYQRHPAIDEIYVVCLKGWENILTSYAKHYEITKLTGIIQAGDTGIKSVNNGVDYLKCRDDDIIIFQESTRPLVTEEIISKLLHACKGSIVVYEPMDDYIQFYENGDKKEYVERDKLISLQSPEAYEYGLLREAFEKAEKTKHRMDETTCAMMMYNLGYELNLCEGNHNNIKVVRQEDITILSALMKSRT